jgi:tetratricopeptide (TPR) repeat protein
MIARNEAANLAACLAPLVPLVRETVVVDTGSTDATRSIALSLGAHVFDFPWCDDFAAARNESLRHATGDWILWMDADDRLDPENTASLSELLTGLGNESVAHLMSCVSLASDGQASFEAKHIRLFPSSPAHRWTRRVHEQILPSLLSSGCLLRETGIAVHHVGYQDHALFMRKIERNLRLVEVEYADRQPDGWYFHQRGSAFFDLRRYAEAIVDLQLAAALARTTDAARVHSLLAEALAHEQGLEAALDAACRGREFFPSSPDLLLLEAQILGALGQLGAAEATLAATLDGVTDAPNPFDVVDATLGLRGRHLLARVHLLQGRADEAEHRTREVLRDRPAFGPAALTLAECLLRKGDIEGFDGVVRAIPDDPEALTGRAVLAAMRATHHGDCHLAIDIVMEALAHDPRSTFLKRARALALVAADHPEAPLTLDALLRDHPLDMELRAAKRQRG